jgi:integrase
MATIEMKGLYKVVAKGRTYWYAWRNGPRIDAEPGTAKFLALYGEAVAERGVGDKQRFKSIAVRYRASKDYRDLADSTRRNWGPWIDQIIARFGELRTKLLDRSAIRKDITRWRAEIAEKRGPRAADYGMQVLSRICAYGIDPLGEMSSNPCEGIKQVYKVNRSEIIWTDSDIAHLKVTCSKEVALAVDLAAYTGLRVGDLIRLSWSHVGEDAIIISTGKSRHRREAIIPLYDDLRDLLKRIPRKSPVILTSSTKRPWTRDGLSSSFADAKKVAWPPAGRDLHFHDLRGTAVTKFYIGGLDIRVIAEMMAWEEDHVAKIIRRYVNRSAAIKDTIRRLNEAKDRT